VFRDRKPPARPKSQPKVIRDSNKDFRINQDQNDVAVSMLCMVLWIHYLVGVSHFAECRENWLVTANANKSLKTAYSAMVREVEK